MFGFGIRVSGVWSIVVIGRYGGFWLQILRLMPRPGSASAPLVRVSLFAFCLPVFGLRSSVFGFRFLVFGFRFSIFGFQILGFGFIVQGSLVVEGCHAPIRWVESVGCAKGTQVPMAQGRSTKIISMIKWIRTSRYSISNSLFVRPGLTRQ